MDTEQTKNKSISVIIPVCNEQENILPLYDELINTFDTRANLEFDILFVDDGSNDDSWTIIRDLRKNDNRVTGIRLSRNFGHQMALLAGYDFAGGDLIVTLDADLQDPPELIGEMINKSNEGFDIVYAARSNRVKDSFLKRFTAKAFYKLMAILGVEVIPNHAEFRLITKRVLKHFLSFRERNLFIRGTIPLIGYRHYVLSYERSGRKLGKSKYSMFRMLEFALNGLTSFSILPLRLCSLFGVSFSVLALVLLAWNLLAKFLGITLVGWIPTIAAIYFIGGVQLFFLGIVGEYIGRIYIEVKERPRYIVDEIINNDQEKRIL